MIKIENISIHGLEETIRGMRNPMNSWDKSDSGICKGGDDGIGCENCAKEVPCEHTYDHSFQLGKADHELMMKLAAGGPVHAKYRRIKWAPLPTPALLCIRFRRKNSHWRISHVNILTQLP